MAAVIPRGGSQGCGDRTVGRRAAGIYQGCDGVVRAYTLPSLQSARLESPESGATNTALAEGACEKWHHAPSPRLLHYSLRWQSA